jgi:hypothetical protein
MINRVFKNGYMDIPNQLNPRRQRDFQIGKLFAETPENIRMKIFLAAVLWCMLFVLCWPLALLMLFLFPLVWLILLPFRIVGFTIGLIFKVISAVLLFPFRMVRAV